MSIVLMGSTSGSCTLQEQAVAGTSVLTLPVGSGTVVANNVNSAIVSGTAVASTSGTSIDFTGIPSWAKRITVMFTGVSTNGSSNIQIQLGDSGGIETTGYLGSSSYTSTGSTTVAFTTGIGFHLNSVGASVVIAGSVVFNNVNSNIWVASGSVAMTQFAAFIATAGNKTLSDVLDRVRITTVNGTDTFDAGSINIMWE